MAISLTQQPADIDAIVGPNIFTLNDPTTTAPFFVLDIWDGTPEVGASVRLGTLYQSVNKNQSTIFDIKSILESYVTVSKDDFDRLGNWNDVKTPSSYWLSQPKILADGANESMIYYVRYGSTTTVGVEPTTWSSTTGPFVAFNGVKPWYDVTFDFSDAEYPLGSVARFTGKVSGDAEGIYNCSFINEIARPLSDNQDRLRIQDCGYAYPIAIGDNPIIGRHYVTSDDFRTKSWINDVRLGEVAPDASIKGIDAFYIVVYNGTTELANPVIPNVIANGGGPNTTYKQGTDLADPYFFTSIGTGPANLDALRYVDTGGSLADFDINEDEWTHYWVYPVVGQVDAPGGECGQVVEGANIYPLGEPQLYIKKELDCLDFEPIQVSWLNRLGFRDQFTFRKKNEKRVKTSRNTFTRSTYDPSAATFESDPEYRGETVYSMSNEIEFTATTGYLTDAEAKSLESLWTSPDIRTYIPSLDFNYGLPGYAGAAFTAAILTSNTYTQKTYRKDRLFQYEITFKISNKIESQRG